VHSTSASGVQSCAHGEYSIGEAHRDRFYASGTFPIAQFILRDCHSGNLRRVVAVASTAPFGPSALMLNW
jgi:hypothetical protein